MGNIYLEHISSFEDVLFFPKAASINPKGLKKYLDCGSSEIHLQKNFWLYKKSNIIINASNVLTSNN